MIKSLAAFGLLVGLFVAVAPPVQAMPVTDLAQPVSIAGQWRFQIGDDLAWASPGFNDSDWQSTAVPAYALTGQADYSGMFWYRHALQLDLSQPPVQATLGALAIAIGNVTSAYELYAGGVKVGSVGRLPPEPVSVYDRKQVLRFRPRLSVPMASWLSPCGSGAIRTSGRGDRSQCGRDFAG